MTSPPPPPPPRIASGPPWGTPATRPGDDHPISTTLVDAIVLVAWSLLGQLLIGLAIGVVVSLTGGDVAALQQGRTELLLVIVVQSGVLAGALAWLAGTGRLDWRLTGSVRPRAVHVAQGIGWGLLTVAVTLLVAWLGTLVTGSDDGSGQTLLDPEQVAGVGFWLVLVAAGLLAPITEEIVFRGVLFQQLGRRLGWTRGLLVTSLVFAIVHVEVLASGGNAVVFLVALAVVGVLLGVAFNRSRSLVVPVVAHATFNSVQLLLARYGDVA